MSNRSFVWTPEGKASTILSGLSLADAVEALYSARQIDNAIGDQLLVVCGEIRSGALVTVMTQRIAGTSIYKIEWARPTNEGERQLWRRQHH